jgi:transcriptional regulator with XRE-family HTH domain
VPKSQTLGARVAQARRELSVRLRRDVSASDMAKALGVSPATVYRWESDEKSPKDDSLDALAKFLGVTPAFLRYGVVPAVAVIDEEEEIIPVVKPSAKKRANGRS